MLSSGSVDSGHGIGQFSIRVKAFLIQLIIFASILAGCSTVPTVYMSASGDPRKPIERTQKFWIFAPADESLEQRRLRYAVESALTSNGIVVVNDPGAATYVLDIETRDDTTSANRNVTHSSASLIPLGTGLRTNYMAFGNSTETPVTRSFTARRIWFEVTTTESLARYFQTKEKPMIIWEGYIGTDATKFDVVEGRVLRDFFATVPTDFPEHPVKYSSGGR